MHRFVLCMLPILITICGASQGAAQSADKDYAVGKLHFTLPATYKVIEPKGIDSYVAWIINDKNDTFHLEYGYGKIIDRLVANPAPVLPMAQKESLTRSFGHPLTSEDAFFSNSPQEDREQAIFLDNYYMYDTINNIVVKLVQPKRIGHGITGIYIPETEDIGALSIYAKNLDSSANLEALNLFRTVRKL